MSSVVPSGYEELLSELKARIRSTQLKAMAAANRELILLHWEIGRSIVLRQEQARWGKSVIERLARDLHNAFPEMSGFSPRNLWRMRSFYVAWREVGEILPQAVAELPWGHNALLLEKLKSPEERLWYAEQARGHGWSRPILGMQIESRLHLRVGQAVTNFPQTLPPPGSDLARQALKDPYLFDFLNLAQDAEEREIEGALVAHMEKFLLELGAGFAFVGRQYHLEVGEDDFYLDLLFYHLRLRCFVVIELKAVPFKPEFTGQLNFYMAVVDDRLRHATDEPTIGLLLCKGKNRLTAEYALRGINRPIGVADWETELVRALPEDLKGSLPTIEEIEQELAREEILRSAEE